jgi:hypothetical protein
VHRETGNFPPFSLLSKNVKTKIYKNIIVSVILYGCETLSISLSKEQRLRAFDNRVLRRAFGSKWDKMIRSWRHFRSDELHNFYSSSNIKND